VQEGFMQCHGLQCGVCTPGMMMTARHLLDRNPDPSDQEIREAISGQICRCTGYATIVRSVRWAAMHEAAAHAGVGPAEVGPAEVGPAEVGPAEVADAESKAVPA
jgi:carbon-monoxide dehydrogenase small subunit